MSLPSVPIPAHAEIYYGNDVEKQLHAGGWRPRTSADYAISCGLVLKDLFAFLEATQPGHYYALVERGAEQLAADLKAAIAAVGTAAAFKLAYQLAYLTTEGTTPVFDKVLVVTDRIALDRQLGGVLSFMQGTTLNQMTSCSKTRDLLRELTGSTRIVDARSSRYA